MTSYFTLRARAPSSATFRTWLPNAALATASSSMVGSGGGSLEELYAKCDLGLEMLPPYPKNSSSLKSRDYMARGIPFVTAATLNFRDPEIRDYVLQVPATDAPIDVGAVLAFLDRIYGDWSVGEQQRVIDAIADYARRNYDIRVTMQPIIDYINS